MATYSPNVIQIPVQLNPVELARLNKPLLAAVQKWTTPDEALKWNANFGGASATGESVTASISNFSSDTVDQASLPIGSYRLRSSFQILTTKFTQAQARGGDALANLLSYSSMAARREIITTLGQKIVTGTGSSGDGGVVGINAIASALTANTGTPGKQTSTNAYANIDPTVAGYEKWTNLVYDSFGALTAKKLAEFDADLRQGTTTGVPSSYDVLVMSPVTAVKYVEVFSDAVQTTVAPVAGVDLGVGMKTYNGKPIIEDPSITDGEVHFIDSSQVRLYSFNQAQAGANDMNEEQPYEGILLYAAPLPSDNPQMLKYAMYGMFQLQLRDRSAHSVLRGITL